MRLIDKDLVLKTAKDKEWGLWCEIVNIKFAPEVKAIPIEWIEKYIWGADTHEEKRALRKMYIAWEKENELDKVQ